MGQKVNPISNRLGVIRGWDSNWYGGKKYGETLLEDSKIRKYLRTRLAKASVSRIIIERTLKMVTVTICTSRPGMIIGKGGKDVEALKAELQKLTHKDDVQINIHEIKRPELDAEIVAANIARQIENKVAYRRLCAGRSPYQGGHHRHQGVDLPWRSLRTQRTRSLLCRFAEGDRPPRRRSQRRIPQQEE